ncbi:MAG: DUF2169 domain-containing protein [Polyangiaceae bacterium]
MEIVALTPLPVAALYFQPEPSSWAVSLVCKATFALTPGVAQLHDTQEAIEDDDRYWDDDPAKSVFAPCDLVPMKAAVDVLLVGHAFAHQPVASSIARIAVGSIDKSIEVVRNRAFTDDGRLLFGRPWFARPLRYEHAGGGPGTDNPVGIAPGTRDRQGRLRIPHLQPPGFEIASPSIAVPPVGFGPIAPTWPPRARRIAHHNPPVSWADFRTQPLPSGLDRAYFNSAPRDQQLASLPAGAPLLLEGLLQDHPLLQTRLPGLRPRAFRRTPDHGPTYVPMPVDTLWIDTDRAIVTVSFRACVPIGHPLEVGRIVIGMESPGEHMSWEEATRRAREPGGIDQRLDADAVRDQWGPPDFAHPFAAPDGASPRARGEPPTLPLTPLDALRAMSWTLWIASRNPESPGPKPPTPALLSAADMPSPATAAADHDGAQPTETSLLAPDLPLKAAFCSSRSLRRHRPRPRSQRWCPIAPLESIYEDRMLPVPVAPSAPIAPSPRPPPFRYPLQMPSLPSPTRAAHLGSASSDSACPPAPCAPSPSRRACLFDCTGPGEARSRRSPPAPVAAAWAPLLPQGGQRRCLLRRRCRPTAEACSPSPAPEPRAATIRRDRALCGNDPSASRAPPPRPHPQEAPPCRSPPLRTASTTRRNVPVATSPQCSVPPLLATPPAPQRLARCCRRRYLRSLLVVLSGDLEMVFDEVETWKATLAAVSPFTASDPKLTEAVDLVSGLLQTPWLQAAPASPRATSPACEASPPPAATSPDYLAEHTDSTSSSAATRSARCSARKW